MCGIVGYIGERKVIPVLMEGLRRLEYRGYDSAGVVFFRKGALEVVKTKGRILDLEEKLFEKCYVDAAAPGLGHTRWATHGEPSDKNAHPHFDCTRSLAVVHNGIIENYYQLKSELLEKGHFFSSATDTEVIAHLIEEFLKRGCAPFEALCKAAKRLKGSYALAVVFKKDPEALFVARNQSPVVIGLGEGENFVASDIPALLPFTREVIFLEDGEVAILTKEKVSIFNPEGKEVIREPVKIEWDLASAEKGGYPHFMLKEIYEQPEAIQHTSLGRINQQNGEVDFSADGLSEDFFKGIKKLFIVACGTSFHAGLVGKYLIEEKVGIPVEVDLASEFRYRNPLINENTLFIAISQSGETADTLASLREAKKRGAKVLSICNVVGSTIARESDVVLYTQAGPEISVASTKAFTTQVCMLLLLSFYMQKRVAKREPDKNELEALLSLPGILKKEMSLWHEKIKEISKKWYFAEDFLYLGRNILFPIALEGALKIKEIAYTHAEGYAAGEMKHGPIALIEEKVPTVVLAAKETGIIYEKTLSNAEEVASRRGPLIAVVSKGAEEFYKLTQDVIEVPLTVKVLLPILYVIPLQLFAYEIAALRGCDIDKPRNLAKSVTVE